LAFLRIVVGMHFALEGTAHLRDPEWSSAGFRRAAVGPLAHFYRRDLPQTGDWSATLGEVDIRPVAESTDAWQESVVASWKKLLDERGKRVALDEGQNSKTTWLASPMIWLTTGFRSSDWPRWSSRRGPNRFHLCAIG